MLQIDFKMLARNKMLLWSYEIYNVDYKMANKLFPGMNHNSFAINLLPFVVAHDSRTSQMV